MPIVARKFGAHVTVSREVLGAAISITDLFNAPPPTPEQIAEYERQRVAAWAEHHAFRARITSLNDLQRALLDLHSLSEHGECEGCDWSGGEGEPPSWPCRTVELICERAAIPLPDTTPWGEDPDLA